MLLLGLAFANISFCFNKKALGLVLIKKRYYLNEKEKLPNLQNFSTLNCCEKWMEYHAKDAGLEIGFRKKGACNAPRLPPKYHTVFRTTSCPKGNPWMFLALNQENLCKT